MLRLPGSSTTVPATVLFPNLVRMLYAAVAGPVVAASSLLSTASMDGSPVMVPGGNAPSVVEVRTLAREASGEQERGEGEGDEATT